MHEKDASITDLRICAMWMIVACHLLALVQHPLAHVSAMFLNVGVELFFLISAYLYGQRKIINTSAWYRKRFSRIAVPSYVFLALLFGIYLLRGLDIDLFHWFAQFFFLQGWEIYVFGAEHLWFLTILLFCYVITPALQWLEENCSFKIRILVFCASVFAQIFATYCISTQLGRYWLLVNFYAVCYELGARKLKCETAKQFAFAILIGLIAVAGRMIGKIGFDDTILYNIFISGITHCLLAVSIFWCFQFLAPKKIGKAAGFLDSISYEVYLVHFMLIGGPISLMHCTNHFVLNCGVVLIATVALAYGVHLLVNLLLSKRGTVL